MVSMITKVPSMVNIDINKLNNMNLANQQKGPVISNGTLPQSIANVNANKSRIVERTDAAMQPITREATIRDSSVSQQDSGLSKSDVLQQASKNAMAMATSAPQSMMKLLG